MDALARLEPVARPLLDEVDSALATLGAPAEHPVWTLLRTLGATPADAVAYFADAQPDALVSAAAVMRDQAETYEGLALPHALDWSGAAADAYRGHVAALAAHLGSAGTGDGMGGRAAATAAFLRDAADWLAAARKRVARALAEVLGSTQAVTLRTGPALGGGLEGLTRAAEQAPARSVLAAADIGAYILEATAEAWAEGRAVLERWSGELTEVVFRAPAPPTGRPDVTVRLTR
jgi:hypothetical protein